MDLQTPPQMVEALLNTHAEALDALLQQIFTIFQFRQAERVLNNNFGKKNKQISNDKFTDELIQNCARQIFRRELFRIDQVPDVFIAAYRRIEDFEHTNACFRDWHWTDGSTIGQLLIRIFIVWLQRVNGFVHNRRHHATGLGSILRHDRSGHVQIGSTQVAEIIGIIAEIDFPSQQTATKIWANLVTIFTTNHSLEMENQLHNAIVRSAFTGKISFAALNFALSRRNFIHNNPLPRFILQCALLGPLQPNVVISFAIFLRDTMPNEWDGTIRANLEDLLMNALMWKHCPQMFPTAIKEYTKREAPPFDAFWCTIEPIIASLKTLNLIDSTNMDNFDPAMAVKKYEHEERINRQYSALQHNAEAEDEPEYSSLTPVEPAQEWVECMERVRAEMNEKQLKRRHRQKERSARKNRNKNKFPQIPSDSDYEPEYSNLEPTEPNPGWVKEMHKRNKELNSNGEGNAQSENNDIPSLLNIQIPFHIIHG